MLVYYETALLILVTLALRTL